MKHLFLLFGITCLLFTAACSGDGAYTEEEKKEQDSKDSARQETDFEKLEQQDAKRPDTAAKAPLPDPVKNPQVEEPKLIISAEEGK